MQRLVAQYWVSTPLFMGSAGGTHLTQLQLEGVKGAVRFWWRALNYARLCADGASRFRRLQSEEDRLFGAAADDNNPSAKGRSPCRWSARWSAPEPRIANGGTIIRGTERMSGLSYLGGQGLLTIRQVLKRPCFWSDQQRFGLTVELIAPKSVPLETDERSVGRALIDSLHLMGLLGGLGSRKSRGFGSLSLAGAGITLDGRTVVAAPVDEVDYIGQIAALLVRYRAAFAEGLPDFPAISARSRVEIIASARDGQPLKLLNGVGEQMADYRSWGWEARDGEHRTVTGKIAEQNFRPDHDWAKNPDSGEVQCPERIVFGMPHAYTNCNVTSVNPGKPADRRGSPLLIHIHRLTDRRHLAVATVLPARLSPDGTLAVERRDRDNSQAVRMSPDFEEHSAWIVLDDFIARFDARTSVWPCQGS